MNKEKPSPKFNGALLIDKPSGITSHDVVWRVRKITGQKEVGHAGTLDPLASGLLVVLLGEGTKLSNIILNKEKSYAVKARLGFTSDTWDVDGQVTKVPFESQDENSVKNALLSLLNQTTYPLPIYSAVKVKGKKLYEYARENIEVKVPNRDMNFFNMNSLQQIKDNEFSFNVSCSKGSFIRSLVHCLGLKLGTKAIVSGLRRTGSTPFKLEEAITLTDLEKLDINKLDQIPCYKSIESILSKFKSFTISGRDERLMKNGAIPNDLVKRLVYDQKQVNRQDMETYIKIYGADERKLITLLHLQPRNKAKVFRRFKNS